MNRKIGRNDACPCGQGVKFKNCCLTKGIPWEEILARGIEASVPYLSARGKNLHFYNLLFNLLKIEPNPRGWDLEEVKRGFTAHTVELLYEGVNGLWPNLRDLYRVLADERQRISGLYLGKYDHSTLVRGLTRHSLYSDSILLFDPFTHPRRFTLEYNPFQNPDSHRSDALKAALVWLELYPWVRAGIVRFIRSPTDYDSELLVQTCDAATQRRKDHPELRQIAEQDVQAEITNPSSAFTQYWFLQQPTEQLYQDFREFSPATAQYTYEDFKGFMDDKRAAHPYYLEHISEAHPSEFITEFTGENYDAAKHIANYSGSYLITDLAYRWREIELDRATSKIDDQAWSPFAKALSGAQLSCLNNVPLQAAFELRQKGRLEDMRLFLRNVWKKAANNQPFDAANSTNLAAELSERIREARGEYDKIQSDLYSWLGTAATATSLANTWLTSANTSFVGAATGVLTGVATLARARSARAAIERKYPASFFLKFSAA